MNFKEFIDKTNIAIQNNNKNEELLNRDNKFLRANLILKLLQNLSVYLKFFEFKNDIIFEKNDPFIIIDNLKFKLNHVFYLKNSGIPKISEVNNTLSFLKKFNIYPNNIIDLGACWGEYSLFLANEFSNSNIFSVEGSSKNYKVLLSNLSHNFAVSKLIKPFNIIISNHNGNEKITNEIGTMNAVKENTAANNNMNYIEVTSNTLSNFCKNKIIKNIDFIKIDIEGSELKLLDDLLTLPINSIQIELINYNSIKENIAFIKALSNKYNFVNYHNQKEESLDKMIKTIENILKTKSTIDMFLIKK
jgi:FkbM family methyltransferase